MTTVDVHAHTIVPDVFPLIAGQPGFRDEIALADENGTDVIAISLWDTKEQADGYATTAYPAVLTTLEDFLDGPPNVRVINVINSTAHKLTAPAVVAA